MITAVLDGVSLPLLARTVLAVLFDLTLKGVLILALAGFIANLLKNASAASRHLVWSLALCSVLILPILTVTLPALRVPILAEVPYWSEASSSLEGSAVASTQTLHGDATASERTAEASFALATDTATSSENQAVSAVPRPAHEAYLNGLTKMYEVARETPWMVLALFVWMGGVSVVLFRFLVGTAGVWWLTYKARPIHDPAWTSLTEEVGQHIGLRRKVRLLKSVRTAMPMTWGMLHPLVLVPFRADDWSQARRRCVLTHELAHIKRWDCLTQTLAQVTCAISWFNPLVWAAARQMRHEREMACDNVVLHDSIKPSEYARHLLEIARTTQTTLVAPLGTVSMARPSQLEGRVVSILDIDRQRNAQSRITSVVALIFTIVLILPLAVLRPPEPAGVSVDGALTSFERVRTDQGEAFLWEHLVKQGTTIDIRGVRGIVQATPSSDQTVEVVALPQDDTFEGDLRVVREDDGIVICVPDLDHPEACATDTWAGEVSADQPEVHFVAQIPAGVHFSGRTLDGNVTVVGLRGDIEAATVEGDIFVQTTGAVKAHSQEGDIELRTASFARAHTRSGDITARIGQTTWAGHLPFESVEGDITVELPEDADTDIDLHVEAEGHLMSAIQLRRKARDQGERFRGTLGLGGRLLAIHTIHGNITVMHRGGKPLRLVQKYEVENGSPSRQQARPAGRSMLAEADQNEPTPRAEPRSRPIAEERAVEADVERLRRRVGRLEVSTDLLALAADAVSLLDLGTRINKQDFTELVQMLKGDESFLHQFVKLGFEDVTREEFLVARLVGVDTGYIESVREKGYCPSLSELVAMKVAGIDERYIQDMASEGYDELPVEALVELRKSGVDREVILEMEEHGYAEPTVEEMVEFQTQRGPVPQ